MKIFPEASAFCKQHICEITNEIEDWHNTGILTAGYFRKFAEIMLQEVPSIADHKLQVAENVYCAILRRYFLDNYKPTKELTND